MSMDWFRSWHGAPTDPKWLLIAKRSETQPGIVSAIVWALFDHASQNTDDRGNIESFDTETYSAFSGFDETAVKRVIECLKEKSIIVDGHLAAWEKRQTKREDNSTPRVKKHRNAVKHNETPETPREEKIRGEEKVTEAKASDVSVAKATRPERSKFDEFWKDYPKRDGDNPRKPAEKKFNALAKSGVDPDAMIAGAKQASADARTRGIYGTKFVPQAIKWLNDHRFIDCTEPPPPDEQIPGYYAKPESEQLEAWDAYSVRTNGKRLPRDKNQGWRVKSEWPPDHGKLPLGTPPPHHPTDAYQEAGREEFG